MKGDRRMTIREVLARVDTIRQNAYTDGEKIAMLNTIEGRIYREILEKTADFTGEFIPFQEGEEERELTVPVPYTDIYVFYLAAMMDFYNGDSGRYNDTMVLFNQAWEDYAAHYMERYKPKQVNLNGMIPHGRRWR